MTYISGQLERFKKDLESTSVVFVVNDTEM